MIINKQKDSPDHTIYTNDIVFGFFGMSAFTIDSLMEFCETNDKNKSLKDYISYNGSTKPEELYSAILSDSSNPSILFWDSSLKEYKDKKISSYKSATDDYQKWLHLEKAIDANKIFINEKSKLPNNSIDFYRKAGVDYSKKENEDFLKDVNLSFSGCISWDRQLVYHADGGEININPKFSLFLQDPKNDSNKKIIATRQPIISDVPKTAGGSRYGVTYTDNFSHVDGIGSYRIPIDGDENLDNRRAGKLDIYFNHNTGNYEAGTKQIIVRLLADLPPVISPGFNLDTINSITNTELYKFGSEQNQLGNWDKSTHICSGVPLYVQRANPYLFGPNFINMHSKKDKYKKEIIQVINRTTSSFVVNELVICSNINGEWIPQKFSGDAGTSLSFKIEKWAFTKLISDSDSYFKDARAYRMAYDIATGQGLYNPPEYAKNQIDSESYQQKMRNKYYVDLYRTGENNGDNLLKDNSVLNFNPLLEETLANAYANSREFLENKQDWDIQPSERYWQITAFDQMGDFAGGKNDNNIIARTNFSSSPDGTDDPEDVSSLKWLGFWGPSFIDGYDATQTQKLLAQRNSIILKAAGPQAHEFFFSEAGFFPATTGNPAITDVSPGLIRNVSYNYSSPLGMFSNTSDRTAKNLPAEVATNTYPGSPSIGSPLEDLGVLMSGWCWSDESSETQEMVQQTYNILASGINKQQDRYHWLHKGTSTGPENIFDPVYDLDPISPNKVDFFPLSAEMVSSTDYERGSNPRIYGNSTLMERHLRTPKYQDHLFGGDWIFERNRRFHNKLPQRPFKGNGAEINVIPYDTYVFEESKNNSGGVNRPDIWPDDTADCVGIISSKCKIKFSGNNLLFSVNQQFGLQVETVITTGGLGATFAAMGAMVGITNTGSLGSNNTYVRWGGANDRPQDFHTTALHVQIYDQWPDDQTIFDPRYFAVFHFNPNDDSVDFKVPTLTNGVEIAIDSEFDSSFLLFAPEEDWVANKIRRGKMLNNGGFRYIKKVCGIKDINTNLQPGTGGTGYIAGDKLTVSSPTGSGVEIEVVRVRPDDPNSPSTNGEILEIKINNRGEGFLPSDFDGNLKASGGTGTGANIKIDKGIVYGKIEVDQGPKKRSDITRLTDISNRGLGSNNSGAFRNPGEVKGVKETIIEFDEKNITGKYDLFFHFHNDISHTLHSVDNAFYSPVQRVLLEITAS
jgi:hypothetical protein